MISKKRAVGICVFFMLICLFMGVVFGLFFFTGSSPSEFRQLTAKLGYLRQLGEVSSIIDQKFYREVGNEDVFNAAARGMVASLDDKYAAYYTADEFSAMMERQSGKYVGIGVGIGIRENGEIYIIYVNENSPGERAGLQGEDTFIAIESESVEGWTMEELVAKINTFEENPYTIRVKRENQELVFNIKNEEIVNHRVHSEIIDEILYVLIDEFTGDCVEGFEEAIKKAEKSGCTKLLIDLRGNPGGDLNKVVKIADKLLPKGVVLTMRTRDGKVNEFNSKAQGLNWPTVVLVNGHSASASEVLAGALQDREAAKIVGTQTFGKGIVQTVYPMLSGDGHVKLTTAVYYTPSGRSLHGTGITPDVIVELPEKYKDHAVAALSEEVDAQRKAAMDILLAWQ